MLLTTKLRALSDEHAHSVPTTLVICPTVRDGSAQNTLWKSSRMKPEPHRQFLRIQYNEDRSALRPRAILVPQLSGSKTLLDFASRVCARIIYIYVSNGHGGAHGTTINLSPLPLQARPRPRVFAGYIIDATPGMKVPRSSRAFSFVSLFFVFSPPEDMAKILLLFLCIPSESSYLFFLFLTLRRTWPKTS